jgi:alanyl-tRNA synthetase
MEKQKSAARAAGKFEMAASLEYAGPKTAFKGYDTLADEATVLAMYVAGQSVKEVASGQEAIIVLDHTPFYAESGGQAGDVGVIEAVNASFEVRDTQKIQPDVFGHHGTLTSGKMAVGDKVSTRVNVMLRAATMRNHSATHLMHKALRTVLGGHGAKRLAGRCRQNAFRLQPQCAAVGRRDSSHRSARQSRNSRECRDQRAADVL